MFFKVIVGPFMILTVIYFFLALYALVRMYNLFKAKNTYNIGITFYIIILIHCFFRTASSCYLTYVSFAYEINKNHSYIEDFSKIFVNILYIPDIFFWDTFAILFWQLLESFQRGHLSSSRGDYLEDANAKYAVKSDLSIQCFIMIVLLASGTQVVLFCLFNLDMFYVFDFVIENAVYNLIIPFVLLITEIILHVQFSGIPYRSLFDSENKSKINKRIIFWGITRSLQGAFDIIVSVSKMPTFLSPNSSGFFDEDDVQSIVFIVSILAGKILTEIIPFGIVFDKEFITFFFQLHFQTTTNNNAEFEIKLLDQENRKGKESQILAEDVLNISQQSSSVVFSKNDDSATIDINLKKIDYNFIYFDPSIKERKRANGLGTLRLGYLNKDHTQRVSLRRVDIPKQKFSKYILEEILKDMNKYMNLQMNYKNYIVKFKGYYISQNSDSLIFFYDYYHNGSLTSFLNNIKQSRNDGQEHEMSSMSLESIKSGSTKKIQLTYEFKLKLIYQIANAMNYLHSNDPPIIHGHLSPNNILFNSKNEPIIADLGFHCLKKYCKFMIGYINKTEYTAPEYLEEKSNVVENARPGADIYSFGMIVWELITEMKPFKMLQREDLINKVVIEKSRPKIPDNIPTEISQIIRACWQQEEDKRPSFTKILKLLENLI